VSARRTERLVNLVICLLATRRFLTHAQIRAAVPGYETDERGEAGEEAFRRMFERDKAELRDLGIPLETGTNSIFDVDPGYRIARRDYELPPIDLEPDEVAAVGLAARLWSSAGLASATGRALVKLRAAGVDVDPAAGPLGLEPRVDATEPAFGPLLEAVTAGRAVRFDYRGGHSAETTRRLLEPWGVVSWRGRWYVVGHDRDRAATRVFRLSRIVGRVQATGAPGAVHRPDGLDLLGEVTRLVADPAVSTATVRVRRGAAAGLRRAATAVRPGADGDELEVPYADPDSLAARIAGAGADAVVLWPPELRAAVVHRLQALAAGGAESVGGAESAGGTGTRPGDAAAAAGRAGQS